MTRINCIPVEKLPSKLLLAEYREMLRTRNLAAGNNCSHYKLGTGHVKFFNDKGIYLINRHRQLVSEMNKRGYQTNYRLELDWDSDRMNDWQPDVDSKIVNVSRIINRMTK
jgi:deoxyribonuclease (pyrimidine dimer)